MQENVTILGVETSFRANALDGAFTVTLGDLYAEERKDFLVRLQVSLMQIFQLVLSFQDAATLLPVALVPHSKLPSNCHISHMMLSPCSTF